MANLAPQIIEDLFGAKTFTVIMTLRDSGDTVNLTNEAIIINSNDGGAVVSNNNTSEITIVGSQAQVNTAMQNIKFRPSADYITSIGIRYNQSDDNATATPGSNPETAFMPLNISSTHNEHVITSAQTYDEDKALSWNLGYISDTRPDNIDSNIVYTMTATLSDAVAGELGKDGSLVYEWLDNGGGVFTFTGTKTQCNTLLATSSFTPSADYILPFTITYGQNQDTNSVDQTSHVINITVVATHDEHNITASQTYSTDTTAIWDLGDITDQRPDNIDENIIYSMTLTPNTLNTGVFTNWDGPVFENILVASDGVAGDNFGFTGSISSNGMVAVSGSKDADFDGAIYIFSRTGNTWTQDQKVQSSDKNSYDKFGYSVAISGAGDTIVVGAEWQDTGGDDAGAAYVFTRSDINKVLTGTIDATASTAVVGVGTLFTTELVVGQSILVSGEVREVIAIADNLNLTVDTAFANTANDTTPEIVAPYWTEQQKLQASDKQIGDRFGSSVAISSDGDTLIVGARHEDTGGSNAGAAYVFTRSGTTWTEEQKLLSSDGLIGDKFGFSVAMSGNGNNVIIGARLEDTGGSNAGAAYVFTRSGTTWTEEQKLQASDKAAEDMFGYSVGISNLGDTAIVGAINEATGGSNAGAAYVFTRSGTTWTEEQKLQASDKAVDDAFGYGVGISSDGDTVICGAPQQDTGGFEAGAAYVFTRSGTTWTEFFKISAGGGGDNTGLGSSMFLASDGEYAAVGAINESLYIFNVKLPNYTFSGTKAVCNAELNTIEFVPDLGVNKPFDITYSQHQDTDGVDQGTDTISITNV